MNPVAKTLGARIKRLRLARGRTQNDVATDAGISQPQLGRIEGGECIPKIDTFFQIVRSLGPNQKERTALTDLLFSMVQTLPYAKSLGYTSWAQAHTAAEQYLYRGQVDEAYGPTMAMIELAAAAKDPMLLAESYKFYGGYLYEHGNYDEAMDAYLDGLRALETDQSTKAVEQRHVLQVNLADALFASGAYDPARAIAELVHRESKQPLRKAWGGFRDREGVW